MTSRSATPPRMRAGTRLAVSFAMLGMSVAALGTASAATYYLGTGGSDSNNGLSQSARWATMGKANSTLRAGDECRILAGSYSAIAPTADGTAGSRITYVGNLLAPQTVVVSGGISLSRSYVTVKGVSTVSGGLSFSGSAAFDSIAWCASNTASSGTGFGYTRDNVIYGCQITGGAFTMDAKNPALPGTDLVALRNTFRRNTFTGTYSKFQANQYCTVDSNRFYLTLNPGVADDQHFRAHYVNRYNQFKDNLWVLRNNTATARYAHHIRDSSEFNHWTRDTILQDPASVSNIKCMFSTSGAYNLVRYNTYRGMFIKVGDVAWLYQASTKRDSIINCTLVSTGGNAAFQVDGPSSDSLVFVHNTVVSLGGSPTRGVYTADGVAETNHIVRHNIFYSPQTSTTSNSTLYFHGPIPVGGNVRNHNLYYSPAGAGSNAAVKYQFTYSAVGLGTPWNLQPSRPDSSSRWGDPMFSNTSTNAFDPTPRVGSAAIGGQWPDGYVGAIGALAQPDVTPPAGVVDLASGQVANNSAVLQWTAPGDDGMSGLASFYQLRWSTSPIDNGSFGSATLVSPSPPPAVGGSFQNFVLLGLQPGTTYYVALKAYDEAGNASPLSNVLPVTTLAADTIAPASISDLTATP